MTSATIHRRGTMMYRGYRAEDFEAMFALDEICFEPPFRFSRTMMRQSAEATKAHVVIAGDADCMVGFCIAHVERIRRKFVGYVVTLDVAPEHRLQGIASELMHRIEIECALAECEEMMLHVHLGNEKAICFYEREGYERVGQEREFYGQDPKGSGIDAWLYRKTLPAVRSNT